MHKGSYDAAPFFLGIRNVRAQGALVMNHKSKKIPKVSSARKKKKGRAPRGKR